jgi:Lrp/AsnC family leucine-responsive transcriptional regulator
MKLDKKDRELLTLLYLNSRESFTRLGKKLKLSSSSVERRLRRLEREGAVSMLLSNVNFAKLGLRSYRLYFKFDVMDEETEAELIRHFEYCPRTLWGVICQGDYDVLWRVNEKSEMGVEDAINAFTRKFGAKVVEKTVITATYQAYLPWTRAFGGTRQAPSPIDRLTKARKPDEKDMQILAILYPNARQTSVSIAEKVGLTPDAVQYRIKRLIEEKYILGFTAWYDARKLGLEYYKLLVGFRNMSVEKEKKFLDFCTMHDNVVFVNKGIGSWDMEVDIIVEDVVELHSFLRDIKTRFGHLIGRHAYIAAIDDRMFNPLREHLPDANKKKGGERAPPHK